MHRLPRLQVKNKKLWVVLIVALLVGLPAVFIVWQTSTNANLINTSAISGYIASANPYPQNGYIQIGLTVKVTRNWGGRVGDPTYSVVHVFVFSPSYITISANPVDEKGQDNYPQNIDPAYNTEIHVVVVMDDKWTIFDSKYKVNRDLNSLTLFAPKYLGQHTYTITVHTADVLYPTGQTDKITYNYNGYSAQHVSQNFTFN